MLDMSDEELGRSFVRGMALHVIHYEIDKCLKFRFYDALEHYALFAMWLNEDDWLGSAVGRGLLAVTSGDESVAESVIRGSVLARMTLHLDKLENDNPVKPYADMVLHIVEYEDDDTWRYAEELGEKLREDNDFEL